MKSRSIFTMLLILNLFGCTNTFLSKEFSGRNETFIFVHGAHLTSKSWLATSRIFKAQGFETVLVDLPGRTSLENPNEVTLNASSRALCESIQSVDSPIVLIAHSQGGAVANNAMSICPEKNIKGIVYVSAVVPLDGEKPYELLSKNDEDNYFKGVSYDDNTGWMVINDKDVFIDMFTSSGSLEVKREIMEQSVNEPAIIGEGVVHYDNEYYSRLDKFYIFAKFDKIISIESQKRIAGRIHLKNSTVLKSGHLPMLTSPEKLARAIEELFE